MSNIALYAREPHPFRLTITSRADIVSRIPPTPAPGAANPRAASRYSALFPAGSVPGSPGGQDELERPNAEHSLDRRRGDDRWHVARRFHCAGELSIDWTEPLLRRSAISVASSGGTAGMSVAPSYRRLGAQDGHGPRHAPADTWSTTSKLPSSHPAHRATSGRSAPHSRPGSRRRRGRTALPMVAAARPATAETR